MLSCRHRCILTNCIIPLLNVNFSARSDGQGGGIYCQLCFGIFCCHTLDVRMTCKPCRLFLGLRQAAIHQPKCAISVSPQILTAIVATVKISPEERYLLSYEAIAAELQLAKDEITKMRSSNRYLSSQLLKMAVMKVENARLIEEKKLLLQNSDIPSPLTPQSQAQSSSDLVAIPSKQTSPSAPKDAEVIILFFCELMRSRKLGENCRQQPYLNFSPLFLQTFRRLTPTL